MADDVDLPGFVANPFAYMARASAFVLSSAFEGLPGALIQAMACGCPVVSTDCPSGPAEILDGGRFGALVPVGDDACDGGGDRDHARSSDRRGNAARTRGDVQRRSRRRSLPRPDVRSRLGCLRATGNASKERHSLMCGIAGFRSIGAPLAPDSLRRITQAMTATLAHRGPDDADLWIDAEAGMALGHRRLSIIDLSAAGRQPMVSACGRFVITYNGEIYNFRELRAELEQHGHAFRGHSDTEVLLAALAEWGVADALGRAERHVRLRALGPRAARA